MIKAETEKGKISIEVCGNLSEILADLTTIISEIYTELPVIFRDTFLDCISECIPNLVRKSNDEFETEEDNESTEEDNELIEKAAELAMALLNWRNDSDLNFKS